MKKEQHPMWVVSVPVGFETAGKMIKFMRERVGLTQAQLARKVKTKQSAIARLERTKENPSLSRLHSISEALGFSMEAPYFACKKCHKNISECACKRKK